MPERRLVIIFCIIAALRVLVYSAAFPFFNNIDEWAHFDMVVKYSHGHVPRSLEVILPETAEYFGTYNSPEYSYNPGDSSVQQGPYPLWKLPSEKSQLILGEKIKDIENVPNPESTQPPLYYVVAGIWAKIGELFNVKGAWFLYWIRFLNGVIIALLVWLSYVAAKKIFSADSFVILGVPLLVAVLPQDTFYSIQSDVLSPVCFGLAFICLINFLKADIPDRQHGIWAGLSVALAVLNKMSNLVLLFLVLLLVLYKIVLLVRSGRIQFSYAGLAWFLFCLLAPVLIWFAWNLSNTGDLTGTESKIQCMGWTHKSFREFFYHPIFSFGGIKIFWSLLMGSFWRGELIWHGGQMLIPALDVFYSASSLLFIILAFVKFRKRYDSFQKGMNWIALLCFVSLVMYMAVLSVSLDFGTCLYPSRLYPYFVSGRLISAALIPFILLYVQGLGFALSWIRNRKIHYALLIVIALCITVSEIIVHWQVFSSNYNLYHL